MFQREFQEPASISSFHLQFQEWGGKLSFARATWASFETLLLDTGLVTAIPKM